MADHTHTPLLGHSEQVDGETVAVCGLCGVWITQTDDGWAAR